MQTTTTIAMASLPPTSSLLIISILLSISIVSGSGGFSIDLIHRDSPLSPYYNHSATTLDHFRAAAARSITHHLSFGSELIFENHEYLMTLYLGTPSHKILAIADTGSDVTWIQCKPCDHCMNKTAPLFYPASSSTYAPLSCASKACHETDSTSCSSAGGGRCLYQVLYRDHSATFGDLSTETFGFDSAAGGGKISIPNMVFGCAHETRSMFAGGTTSGIVGLGRGPSSLISQLGPSISNRFSYCLVPPIVTSVTSKMNFGDAAVVAGNGAVSTPLFRSTNGVGKSYYWLSLQEIGVGRETVTVAKPPSASSSHPNIIIDSGTTLTFLPSDVVGDLEEKMSGIIKLPRRHAYSGGQFNLCYKTDRIMGVGIPDLTFRFAGASVTLSPRNTFGRVEVGVFCLLIVRSGDVGVSIYGNVAQHNFHIGYDLGAEKLYFAPSDCSKL